MSKEMIDNMKSKVALVRCDSYDREKVKKAVEKAIGMLGGFDEIFAEITRDSLYVLKPNLLTKATPDKAATTHPEVFRAVAELLQESGRSNIKYGDSPGNPLYTNEKTADACGIGSVAKELGIPAGNFDEGVEVEYPDGRIAHKFVLCKEIADLVERNATCGIINICKMKTHQLERITGAVKNTFGCVYGINKGASHATYPTAETFAKMVADLNRLVVPGLHVMDGIVAMEGNGPGSGDPVEMNVILVSRDPVALDAAFCHLINLDPDLVPTHLAGIEAGIGRGEDDDVSIIVGNMPMIPDGSKFSLDEIAVKWGNGKFDVHRSKDYKGAINMIRPFARFFEKKPTVIRDRCVGCGICIKSCPVEDKAICMGADMKPVYDYTRCIKCYCCQEMCPEKAIHVRKSLIARIADRKWGI